MSVTLSGVTECIMNTESVSANPRYVFVFFLKTYKLKEMAYKA